MFSRVVIRASIVTVLIVAVAVCALAPGFKSQTARAGDIPITGAVFGTGIIRKQVLSLRELKFKDLVQQRTDFSCGAASVATILVHAYGIPTNENLVLREMLKFSDEEVVYRQGFSLLDMKNFSEALGMKAVGFKIGPEELWRVKIPSIVLLDINGYKHFVVLKLASRERVYVGDPALGNRVMSIDEFGAAWNGVILSIVGNNYDIDNALRFPGEPASARVLLADRAPIIDTNTIGFGLEHAGLIRF